MATAKRWHYTLLADCSLTLSFDFQKQLVRVYITKLRVSGEEGSGGISLGASYEAMARANTKTCTPYAGCARTTHSYNARAVRGFGGCCMGVPGRLQGA